MKIENGTTPQAAIAELTSRLVQRRIEMGFTQAQLAQYTGLSKRTIERVETGHDTQVSTLIGLLKALGLIDRLNELIPEKTISPIEMLRNKKPIPKRVRRKKGQAPSSKKPWIWGDEK